jgi:Na+/proline symporter
MTVFAFGAGTQADQAVSVASKSFTNGLSGIWYQWLYLPVTPFYWLIAPLLRRFRAITTSDVFEARFDRSVSMLFAAMGAANMIVSLGLMLRGSGEVISGSTGGALSAHFAIIFMTVLFLTYGIFGGLAAAIFIDFIQGILIVIFSFMLLPLIMKAVGGLQGLHQSLANTEMMSMVVPTDISIFYITVIALTALIGSVTQPSLMGNCGAGKTEIEGAVGLMAGNFLKRFCTIPWCLVGVAGIVYFAGRQVEPDKVFGMAAYEFLPKLMPGLLGIFITGVIASVLSTSDATMISAAALFTENIYRPWRPDKSKEHYILIGRISSAFTVAASVIFAYWVPGVVKGLEIFWIVTSLMGIVFWLGLFWRRTTVAGAWASTLISVAIWWISTKPFFISFLANLPFAESLRLVVEKPTGMEMYLPWQMIFYLAGGLVTGVVVSLFTKPVSEEKLDNFYALVRTPITLGEEVSLPCTLPADAIVPPKRNIFPNTSLEIPVPSRTAVLGFLAGWVLSAIIVSIVYLISNQ